MRGVVRKGPGRTEEQGRLSRLHGETAPLQKNQHQPRRELRRARKVTRVVLSRAGAKLYV